MTGMHVGPRNLITDVPGLRVGNAADHDIMTGTTVLTADDPFTCGVHVMGGAPGTRETDVLSADRDAPQVDALFLSGGSAFGLDAGSGVMDALAREQRLEHVAIGVVPVVRADRTVHVQRGGLGRDVLERLEEEVRRLGGDQAPQEPDSQAIARHALDPAQVVLEDAGLVVNELLRIDPEAEVLCAQGRRQGVEQGDGVRELEHVPLARGGRRARRVGRVRAG